MSKITPSRPKVKRDGKLAARLWASMADRVAVKAPAPRTPSHRSTPESVLSAPTLHPIRIDAVSSHLNLPRNQRRAMARALTANPKRAARLVRRAGIC